MKIRTLALSGIVILFASGASPLAADCPARDDCTSKYATPTNMQRCVSIGEDCNLNVSKMKQRKGESDSDFTKRRRNARRGCYKARGD